MFKESSLEDIFAWASENGLSSLQLDGCPEDLDRVKALLDKYPDVEIHVLGRAQNYLVGDASAREKRAALLRRDIEAAAELGIGVVNVFAGRDPYKTVEENLPIFAEVFTPLVEVAERYGVRLAMENCAQRNWWPAGGNLASTVENWRMLFELIPSPYLGLTFDPSHFVWQGMDYLAALREFGERVYYVHAKDTEVLQDQLAVKGIYGQGWWRYRLPGWGSIDWVGFFTGLMEIGYEGPVGIEAEDPLWSENDAKLKQGILKARDFLVRFV
jgi:sugar phosphate isomerase/epimerase